MFRVAILCSLVLYVTSVNSGDPPGHLQPLGSHKPPIKVEIRENVPNPVEFFNRYIIRSKPVVFKGAAKIFPNYKTWKNDEYLRKKYGKSFISVEKGKYEGSVYGKYIFMFFKKFLDNYQSEEYYIIRNIAIDDPMRDEISLLKALACGGYDEHIKEILLLFSSGSTQSALHWDGVDNMHCVMDGTKEWIMFDRKVIPRLTKLKNQTAYAEYDCRSVDMYKYPEVQELDWYHAFLEAGDCLYVPHSWPHHVRSSNRRSMALAVWISPMAQLNMSSCPQDLSNLPDFVPVGRNVLSEEESYRSSLVTFFHDRSRDLSKNEFYEHIKEYQKELLDEAENMFEEVDDNEDGFISTEEIANLSLEEEEEDIDDYPNPEEDIYSEVSVEQISNDEL